MNEIKYYWSGELHNYQLSKCSLCGSAVVSEIDHTEWHSSLIALIKGEGENK